MASHSSGVLRDFCNKGLWLEHGVVADYGPTDEVTERYANQTPRFPHGSVPDFKESAADASALLEEFPAF
ncbi:MAG: hypothetical protein KJZ75_06140 [Hyphomonadaceae bacterium]|nr:hypothetical protein [Hyphomonadaceae bacterium]